MDSDRLRNLLDGGETLDVEFKGGSVNDSELVEAIACLANASGGMLLIGVDDKGKLAGAAPRHSSETLQAVEETLVGGETAFVKPAFRRAGAVLSTTYSVVCTASMNTAKVRLERSTPDSPARFTADKSGLCGRGEDESGALGTEHLIRIDEFDSDTYAGMRSCGSEFFAELVESSQFFDTEHAECVCVESVAFEGASDH